MRNLPGWTLAVLIFGLGLAVGVCLMLGDDRAVKVDAPGPNGKPTPNGAQPAVAEAAPTERTLVPLERDVAATMVEVRVVDAKSGTPASGAVVWHVPPDFQPGDLPTAQQNLYSRATERFLAKFGHSVRGDASGRARIPRPAAMHVVLACVDDRRGTNSLRDDGMVLEIHVEPFLELVIETVDPMGTPVPHVRIDAIRAPNGIPHPMSRWQLGTTDDEGRWVHGTAVPTGSDQAQLWLYARVMGKDHSRVVVDLRDPPSTPVRLTVPATGVVRVRLVGETGVPLPREVARSVRAEVSSSPGDPVEKRLYRDLDSEGWAEFEGVEFERDLFLRFPPVIDVPVPFAGPRSGERTITVVHSLTPGHPAVAGALVDANHRPVANTEFSLFVMRGFDAIGTCGGRTGPDGTFVTHLPSSVAGEVAVTLRFGMDWSGLTPSREVVASPAAALVGRVELGTLVLSAPR